MEIVINAGTTGEVAPKLKKRSEIILMVIRLVWRDPEQNRPRETRANVLNVKNRAIIKRLAANLIKIGRTLLSHRVCGVEISCHALVMLVLVWELY